MSGQAGVVQIESDRVCLHHSVKSQRTTHMNLLKPAPGYKVSPALVAINVLVFIALAILNLSLTEYSIQSLYMLGANSSQWIDQGQWWRMVTSLFLHFGLMHLLFNSVSLLFLGRFLEPLLGHTVFLVLYLLMGIGASLTSYIFNKDVISAGASGAIFGLFGIFIVLMLTNLIERRVRQEWLKSIGVILAINLGMGLILPVDNAAHLGGLAAGLICGVLVMPWIRRRVRLMQIRAASRL